MYDEILIFSNLPAGEQARRGRKKAFGERETEEFGERSDRWGLFTGYEPPS